MSLELAVGVAAILVGVAAIAAAGVLCWFLFRNLDHTQRIQRRQAGLPEVPRDKVVPPKEREALPAEIRDLIAPWGSAHVRRQLEEDARRLRSRGAPWGEIKRMLEVEPQEDAGG